jgi:hypothetical protein
VDLVIGPAAAIGPKVDEVCRPRATSLDRPALRPWRDCAVRSWCESRDRLDGDRLPIRAPACLVATLDDHVRKHQDLDEVRLQATVRLGPEWRPRPSRVCLGPFAEQSLQHSALLASLRKIVGAVAPRDS